MHICVRNIETEKNNLLSTWQVQNTKKHENILWIYSFYNVVFQLTDSLDSNTDPVERYPQKVTNVFLKYQQKWCEFLRTLSDLLFVCVHVYNIYGFENTLTILHTCT